MNGHRHDVGPYGPVQFCNRYWWSRLWAWVPKERLEKGVRIAECCMSGVRSIDDRGRYKAAERKREDVNERDRM